MNQFGTTWRRRARGITLLEVLLSIAVITLGIFGVMALIAAGQTLMATLRIQTQALIAAAQAHQYILPLWRTTGGSLSTYSRCSSIEAINWTWRHSPDSQWVPYSTARLTARSCRPSDNNINFHNSAPPYYALDALFANPNFLPLKPAKDPVAIDPCALFADPGPSSWTPSSIYVCNTIGAVDASYPQIRSLRISIADTASGPSPPAMTRQGALSRYAGIDDLDYDAPTVAGGPPIIAYENGRRRAYSDFTIALFMILGGREADCYDTDDSYVGYQEIIGVFHKRQTESPEGCIFVGTLQGGGVVAELLPSSAGQSPNCVPSFPAYRDGTTESISRHSSYLKPGKLLLVRRPDIMGDYPKDGGLRCRDQWSFQRVISSSRKGTADDTDSSPQWFVMVEPATPNTPLLIDASKPGDGETMIDQPYMLVAFDDLVLVRERYDW